MLISMETELGAFSHSLYTHARAHTYTHTTHAEPLINKSLRGPFPHIHTPYTAMKTKAMLIHIP